MVDLLELRRWVFSIKVVPPMMVRNVGAASMLPDFK